MKNRGLLGQTLHTLGSLVGNQGLQIAAGIAISRVYGPPGKGLVTYAGIVVLGVVAIADGLSSAIARRCGDAGDDIFAAQAAALRIVLAIAAALAIPLAVVGALVPSQRALLFVGIAFPFALFIPTMNAFHLLALRVERTNAASLATNAGAALAMLVATLTVHPSIDVIMALWSAGYIAGAAIVLPGLQLRGASRAAVGRLVRELTRFAWRSSAAGVMTFLAARTDVFIIAATLSATALGQYTLALAAGELMWQLGRALAWSAYGRVAAMPFAAAADLTARITRLVLAVELLVAGVGFALGPAVFTAVYGPAFAATGPVLRILIFGMAIYAADSMLSYFIAVKIGRPGTILAIESVTLALCATGSLLTVGRYGMAGPAIATTAAYAISFAVKSAIFARATGIGLASLLIVEPRDLRLARPVADAGTLPV